jgi:hypothetical protein
MPEVEREKERPTTDPGNVKVYVAAKAEWREYEGLKEVTAVMKGRRAPSAVNATPGVSTGIDVRNGSSRDGVD